MSAEKVSNNRKCEMFGGVLMKQERLWSSSAARPQHIWRRASVTAHLLSGRRFYFSPTIP